MPLQNITVIADHRDSAGTTITGALRLAEAHNAHLTGVFALPPVNIPATLGGPVPPEVIEAQAKANAEAMDTARGIFEDLVKEFGRESRSEWQSFEGDPAQVAALQSRYTDLTVIGQDEPESGLQPSIHDVVMAAGRPVLVIPERWKDAAFGKRVMIAWDESREAARAVGDAMLLLQTAEFVTILTVDANEKPPILGEEKAIALAEHLSRHKIQCQAMYERTDTDTVGQLLQKKLDSTNSDLLVMGAYGESRLRELIMGSTTSFALKSMMTPTLLSH